MEMSSPFPISDTIIRKTSSDEERNGVSRRRTFYGKKGWFGRDEIWRSRLEKEQRTPSWFHHCGHYWILLAYIQYCLVLRSTRTGAVHASFATTVWVISFNTLDVCCHH